MKCNSCLGEHDGRCMVLLPGAVQEDIAWWTRKRESTLRHLESAKRSVRNMEQILAKCDERLRELKESDSEG